MNVAHTLRVDLTRIRGVDAEDIARMARNVRVHAGVWTVRRTCLTIDPVMEQRGW